MEYCCRGLVLLKSCVVVQHGDLGTDARDKHIFRGRGDLVGREAASHSRLDCARNNCADAASDVGVWVATGSGPVTQMALAPKFAVAIACSPCDLPADAPTDNPNESLVARRRLG